MNWQLFIQLLATAGIAMLGWIVAHHFNVRRDQQNKRREIRVGYLIEAYRQLEAGTNRGSIDGTEYGRGFESAIADIQLFGTAEQVRLAKQLAIDIAEHKKDASAGPLLLCYAMR
jgi:hypothetical protein